MTRTIAKLKWKTVFLLLYSLELYLVLGLTEEDEILDDLIPHSLVKRRYPSQADNLSNGRRQFVPQVDDFSQNLMQKQTSSMFHSANGLDQALNIQNNPDPIQSFQDANLPSMQNTSPHIEMPGNQALVTMGQLNEGEKSNENNMEQQVTTSIPATGYEVTTNNERNAEKVKNDVNNYGLWEYSVDNTGAGDNELAKILPSNVPQTHGLKQKIASGITNEDQLNTIGNKAEQILNNAQDYSPLSTKGLDNQGSIEGADTTGLQTAGIETSSPSSSDENLGPGVSVVTIPNTFFQLEDEHGNNLGVVGAHRPTTAAQVLKSLMRAKLKGKTANLLYTQGNNGKKPISVERLRKLVAAYRNSQHAKSTEKLPSVDDKLTNHFMVSGTLPKSSDNSNIKNNNNDKATEKLSDSDIKLLSFVKNLLKPTIHEQQDYNNLLKTEKQEKVAVSNSPTPKIPKVVQSVKPNDRSDTNSDIDNDSIQSILKQFQMPYKSKEQFSIYDEPEQPLGNPVSDTDDQNSELMKYLEHETALVDNFQEGSQIGDPDQQLKHLAQVLLGISRKHNRENVYRTTARPLQTSGTSKSQLTGILKQEEKHQIKEGEHEFQKDYNKQNKQEQTGGDLTIEKLGQKNVIKDRKSKDENLEAKSHKSDDKDQVKNTSKGEESKEKASDEKENKEKENKKKESKEKESKESKGKEVNELVVKQEESNKKEVKEKERAGKISEQEGSDDSIVNSISKANKAFLTRLRDHGKKVVKQHELNTNNSYSNKDNTEQQTGNVKDDKHVDLNKESQQIDRMEDKVKTTKMDTDNQKASDESNKETESKQVNNFEAKLGKTKIDDESVIHSDSKGNAVKNNEKETDNSKDDKQSIDLSNESMQLYKTEDKVEATKIGTENKQASDGINNETGNKQHTSVEEKLKKPKADNENLRHSDSKENTGNDNVENINVEPKVNNQAQNYEEKEGNTKTPNENGNIQEDTSKVKTENSTGQVQEKNIKSENGNNDENGNVHNADRIEDLKVKAKDSQNEKITNMHKLSSERNFNNHSSEESELYHDEGKDGNNYNNKPTAGLPFLNHGQIHQSEVDNDPALKEYLEHKGPKKSFHIPESEFDTQLFKSRTPNAYFIKGKKQDSSEFSIGTTKDSTESAQVLSRIPTSDKNGKLLQQLKQKLKSYYINSSDTTKMSDKKQGQSHLVPPAGQGLPSKIQNQFQSNVNNTNNALERNLKDSQQRPKTFLGRDSTIPFTHIRYPKTNRLVASNFLKRLLSLHVKNYALSKPINLAPLAQLIALAKARQRIIDVTAAKKSVTVIPKIDVSQQSQKKVIEQLTKAPKGQSQTDPKVIGQLATDSKGQSQTDPKIIGQLTTDSKGQSQTDPKVIGQLTTDSKGQSQTDPKVIGQLTADSKGQSHTDPKVTGQLTTDSKGQLQQTDPKFIGQLTNNPKGQLHIDPKVIGQLADSKGELQADHKSSAYNKSTNHPAEEGELSNLQANISIESGKTPPDKMTWRHETGNDMLLSDEMSRMFIKSESGIESKQDSGIDSSDITRSQVTGGNLKTPATNIINTNSIEKEVKSKYDIPTNPANINKNSKISSESVVNQLGKHNDIKTEKDNRVESFIKLKQNKYVITGEPLLRIRHILPFHKQEAGKSFVRNKDANDIVKRLEASRSLSNFLLRKRNKIPRMVRLKHVT